LFWLEECYITCDNDDYRTWCFGWIAMPGDDYIKAIKAKDQVALLVLAYWAILIHRLDTACWYTKGFGSSLVHEISELFPADGSTAAREILRWAQDQ
ncbi:MAG: hypothetical protein M1823_008977, partial [Watsoniomyces obsoletus]